MLGASVDARITFEDFLQCLGKGVRGLTPMLHTLVPSGARQEEEQEEQEGEQPPSKRSKE